MMKSLTRTEVSAWLSEHDRYAIVTHRRPDGDTLGSAAALCLGLRQKGKTAWVLRNPETTEKYTFLMEGICKEAPAEGDTLICVDVASPGMLGDHFAPLTERIQLRIDHHASGTGFTPYSLVDGDAAACGEIIYDILTQMGVTVTKPIANALYTAISTDTGCFRYANTRRHTYEVAAACAHGDLFSLNQLLFETNSLARLRLQGWLIDHAIFLQEGKVCICALPLAVEKQLGVTEDDMENISGFPRSIQGVKLAATLRQEPSGKVKISVRAVPGCDAAAICQKFGGGGHAGAAGCSMDTDMDSAVSALIAAIPQIECM